MARSLNLAVIEIVNMIADVTDSDRWHIIVSLIYQKWENKTRDSTFNSHIVSPK